MIEQSTKVDWLGFRTKAPPEAVLEALADCFPADRTITAQLRRKALNGHAATSEVFMDQMRVGMISEPGPSQRGWTSASLSGVGCEWVGDWDAAGDALGGLDSLEFRRVDIALDTVGAVSHDSMLQAYEDGLFMTGGRSPDCSWIGKSDLRAGRTVYVGDRKGAKFERGYEKGFELLQHLPSFERDRVTHLDGFPVDKMYRVELELKAVRCVLPRDLIDNRDQYFAGAYPFNQSLLDVEPSLFSVARERKPQLCLEGRLRQIRAQYGTSLFTALMAYHGDISAVWDQIVGDQVSRELVAAGVLMFEHELSVSS